MEKYNTLNIDLWKRKEQFYFFKDYENPFFNICADVDVTKLYKDSKVNNYSFFLASLFCSIKSANLFEPFRYRIKDDQVIIYDKINLGSTVLNDDETFNFCYFNYNSDFPTFQSEAQVVLNQNKLHRLNMDAHRSNDDLIYYSVIPWVSFTSFSHARNFSVRESIPKIVFGKVTEKSDKLVMPVSVEVHHALMDGFHVGKYFELFQDTLNSSIFEEK